jgi:hypothetical protein
MMLSLFLYAFVLPGQADGLALLNVRTTYGPLGATRTDEKILPGDQVALSFDIAGAKVDSNGKVRYSMTMEVCDSRERVLFKRDPRDMEVSMPPGQKSLPACATLDAGTEQPPGKYRVKVIVKDLSSGITQEISRVYELLPRDFGLVRYFTSRDPDGKMPTTALQAGRPGWINFSAIGFARDQATGQPDVAVRMDFMDETGRTSIFQPIFGEVKQGTASGAKVLPMQFKVNFPKPGQLIVELTATDKVANRKSLLKVPFEILAP